MSSGSIMSIAIHKQYWSFIQDWGKSIFKKVKGWWMGLSNLKNKYNVHIMIIKHE